MAARWREEAETLRAYGHQHTAASCERHADEMEAARTALLMASVTLEEAAELGG